jgi:hypothetical protein
MIAVITTNKDTFSNPTLYSIFKALDSRGIKIALFCSNQESKIPAELPLVNYFDAPPNTLIPRRLPLLLKYIKVWLSIFRYVIKHKVQHIIAIDPEGLILAGRLRHVIRWLKVDYFSFEIFFKEELAGNRAMMLLKKREIHYSKHIHSIIIQDNKRKDLLFSENKTIPLAAKTYLIPVSPSSAEKAQTSKFKKSDYGLTSEDIVYVHSGSIAVWAGIRMIIDALKKGLPPNTFILIHNKFEFDPTDPIYIELKDLQDNSYPLILHDHVFDDYTLYCNFLSTFEYGIALYHPVPGPHTGLNIKEIGLASGKFATYMSLGMPSILSNCSTYRELNTIYKMGSLVDTAEELHLAIKDHTLVNASRTDCIQLYEDLLRPDQQIANYISSLS